MILEPNPRDLFGHRVRRVKLHGKWWFVAQDLCEALGIQLESSEHSDKSALSCLDVDESVFFQINTGEEEEGQRLLCVPLSGALKLLMRSDIEEAKEFQNWLTIDVLPTLYRDGQYAPRKTTLIYSIL